MFTTMLKLVIGISLFLLVATQQTCVSHSPNGDVTVQCLYPGGRIEIQFVTVEDCTSSTCCNGGRVDRDIHPDFTKLFNDTCNGRSLCTVDSGQLDRYPGGSVVVRYTCGQTKKESQRTTTTSSAVSPTSTPSLQKTKPSSTFPASSWSSKAATSSGWATTEEGPPGDSKTPAITGATSSNAHNPNSATTYSPSPSPTTSQPNIMGVTIGASVGGLILLAVLVGVTVYCVRRKKTATAKSTTENRARHVASNYPDVVIPTRPGPDMSRDPYVELNPEDFGPRNQPGKTKAQETKKPVHIADLYTQVVKRGPEKKAASTRQGQGHNESRDSGDRASLDHDLAMIENSDYGSHTESRDSGVPMEDGSAGDRASLELVMMENSEYGSRGETAVAPDINQNQPEGDLTKGTAQDPHKGAPGNDNAQDPDDLVMAENTLYG